MAEEAPSDRDEMEDKVRKLFKRTQTITTGELGLMPNNSWLTDDGIDLLFNAMKLNGYSFVRK